MDLIRGLGPKRRQQLEQYGITNIADLLHHYPHSYIDLSQPRLIQQMIPGQYCAVLCQIVASPTLTRIRKGLDIVHATVSDGMETIRCTWFNQPYIRNQLHPGKAVLLYGRKNNKNHSLDNPMIFAPKEAKPPMLGVYHLPKGFSQKLMRDIMRQALSLGDSSLIDDWPAPLREEYQLVERKKAIEQIHFPLDEQDRNQGVRRLSLEELVIFQMMVRHIRLDSQQAKPGIAFTIEPDAQSKFCARLNYPLTSAQKRVIREISDDMRSNMPMNRLVQGDVGCGKTIIAVYALWIAARSRYQSVMLAPTEILAQQHFAELKLFFEQDEIEVGLLCGSMKAAQKKEALSAIASGKWRIVVGTHALLQPHVQYERLGLIVTDEQHRFGVAQRAALADKGHRPDTLVMSATPIPRTLSMLLYGDLALSVVDEMPPGRLPVKTRVLVQARRGDLYRYVVEQARAGNQSYVVCPLVEQSELLDITAAQDLAKDLAQEAKDVEVGLMHGKLSAAQKELVMRQFREGIIKILVSTTVIEVGVHIPNANIMIIEDADRFGLAQLHQLRGRVGRGKQQAYCFLLAGQASKEAMDRLGFFAQTLDGFAIAQRDLETRGPGQFLGTRQHGNMGLGDGFVASHMLTDACLLLEAKELMQKILDNRYGTALIQTMETRAKAQYQNLQGKVILN